MAGGGVHEYVVEVASTYEAPMSTWEGIFAMGAGFIVVKEGGFCDLFKRTSGKEIKFCNKTTGITFKKGIGMDVYVRVKITKDNNWHG